MFIKVLGIFDLVSAIIILLNMYSVITAHPVISVGLYLLLKMIIFFGDALSMIDGLAGLIVMINLLFHISWINYIIIAYLVIKGIISLL